LAAKAIRLGRHQVNRIRPTGDLLTKHCRALRRGDTEHFDVAVLSNSIKSFDGLRRRLPPGWGERGEVVLFGRRRQAREEVAHVDQRIDAATLAGDHDGVNDGRTLAGVGMSDEKPILRIMASSP
jgi:hypothetical protein